jgi:O-antigen ligase
VALAAALRPAIPSTGTHRPLDWLLLGVLVAGALQTVPLPRPIVGVVSPAAERVAATFALVDTAGPLALTIDRQDSAAALMLFAGALLLFFTARRLFESGGVRTEVRAIAVVGLILSALAIAQDASAHGLMYWHWRPHDEGPAPFGPYVNRNHFATWAVMAAPLVIGYLVAHTSAHHGAGDTATWRRRVVVALDGRTWLLVTAAAALVVAVAVSLSRSGLVALAGSFAAGALLTRARGPVALTRSTRPVILMIALAAMTVVAILGRVGPTALAGRFAASEVALADRLTIWRDTTSVLRDFWLTGTGVGTFQSSMAVYQRSSPGVSFNQAHNQYLQVAAEGGLLVGVPTLLALVAFGRAARDSLARDRSEMYWVRLGALAGLVGVAVQSLFETGLTTPANAALAAVLAAMAIHLPVGAEPSRLA